MPTSNIYKPITTTNSGILGLKDKIKIGDGGYVQAIPRTQQQAITPPTPPQSGSLTQQRPTQGYSPIVDIQAPNAGLFKDIKGSVSPQITQPANNFSGLVGTLADTSKNGSSAVRKSITGLTGTAKENPGTSGRAYDDYQAAVQRQEKLKSDIAAKYGAIESDTIPLEFQQGREQAMGRQYASQLEAAQGATNQAQQAIQNQLSGVAAQQAGYTQAGNLGLTGQGQAITGLGTAAGLAAPSGNYPFTFDPLTGGFNQAGGGGGIMSAQQAAQDVISGKTGYDQAKAALSYLGGTGEAQLQAAITQAGGNPLQLQAQGAATAQNINTGITTPANTAAAGYSEAVQNYNSLGAVNNSADAQAKQVQSILNTSGLNSSNLNDYTKAINKLGSRIGNEKVTQLTTAMIELQNFYSQLLNTGGITPTGSETAALNTLNPNSSAKQIMASIGELQNAAYNRLNSAYGLVGQYQQNLGGSQSYGGTSNAGSSGGGLYSF